MGLLGPSSEVSDDEGRSGGGGGVFVRSIVPTNPQHGRGETTYSTRDNIGTSSALGTGLDGRGLSGDGNLSKKGSSEYCERMGRPGGLSLLRFNNGSRDEEEDGVWEYPLAGSTIASTKAAVRAGLVEKNLLRLKKDATAAVTPNSIIVGFEAQTSASSQPLQPNSLADKPEASQVSTVDSQRALWVADGLTYGDVSAYRVELVHLICSPCWQLV